MKYTVQSTKYVFKNFFYIFPFAILPAFFLSVSTEEKALIDVLSAIFEGRLSDWTFFRLFRAISILSFADWQATIFGLFGIVVLVLGVALMMAFLDKHFRFGKRTFNGIGSKLNDNLVSTCGYALLLFLLYEIWSLFSAAFLFLTSRIPFLPVAYSLSGLTFIGLHVLLLYGIGLFYLWLPCMQITGFRAFEALRYSYQLMTPVKWKILPGQILCLLLTEALIGACALFLPNFVIFTALTTVLYAFLIMIYCVRMQIAYFDRDSIERMDEVGYYRR